MARLGYKVIKGMTHLLIVPETGLETELVFLILHGDKYPLDVTGEIILTGACVPPQIVLFGNNIVVKGSEADK